MKGMRDMRIYEIIDDENKISIGILLYYEKKKEFIIELDDKLDEWTAPLLFSNLIKQRIYTIPRALSALWVKERIIPTGRQNIKQILKQHKLTKYEEIKFLELSKGRCSQDSCYINKIEALPEYVIERNRTNVVECIACDFERLLCFFVDENIKVVNMKDMTDIDDVNKVLANERLYQSCKVGTGGYSVTFNDSIDIPANILYERGEKIPLLKSDFLKFFGNNLLDTSESCNMLECTRQNMSYMIAQEQLKPVKESVKGNLYLKGEIMKNTW